MSTAACPCDDRRARLGFIALAGILILFAVAKPILYDTMDPDAFWHLRVAEQIEREGVHPLVDHLSFASQSQPWTPYSWLAELGMKTLFDVGGWRAAILMQSLCVGGFIAMLILACAIGGGSISPATRTTPWDTESPPQHSRLATLLAAAFGAYLALPCLSFRPVTFVLLIIAACLVILLRDRQRGETTRAIWCLPPLCILATNMHFYAFLIPACVFLFWLGALAESRRLGEPAGRYAARYAMLWAATLIACCLTPFFSGTLGVIVQYQFFDPMVKSGVITEMQPFMHGAAGKVTLMLVIAASLAIARRWRDIRLAERLLAILGLLLFLRLGRFAPLYALFTCPALAVALPRFSDRLLTRASLRGVCAGILLAGAVRLTINFPPPQVSFAQWLNRHAPDAPGYPTEAAKYVASNIPPTSGRLINEFAWGGYLAWRLGDRYQVLLDGRTQVYSANFWQHTYLCDEPTRRRLLSAVNADAAIVPSGKSKFRDSLKALGWVSVHKDPVAEVMVPPIPPVANIRD